VTMSSAFRFGVTVVSLTDDRGIVYMFWVLIGLFETSSC
jgi:hypothetical protein